MRGTTRPCLNRTLHCRGSTLSEPEWLLGRNTPSSKIANKAYTCSIRGEISRQSSLGKILRNFREFAVFCPRLSSNPWLAVARGSGAGSKTRNTMCRKPQVEVLGSKTGIQLYATAALWGNRMDLSIWPVDKGEGIKEHGEEDRGGFFVAVCLARERPVRATSHCL